MHILLDKTEQNVRYLLQQYTGTDVMHEIFVDQDQTLYYVALVTSPTQARIFLKSAGTHAQIYAHALILGQAGSLISFDMEAHLQHDHAIADIHIVTMLTEGSDCRVSGDVQIHPGIIKTEGRLLEENLVLGKKIKIHTLPKLDVRSNDVSASHGARIEKLDEKKLFYLQSKGISKADAKRLMIEGYVSTMFAYIRPTDFAVQPLHDAVMQQILSSL